MKESLVVSWISGLNITTGITFILHTDTTRRFRWKRNIKNTDEELLDAA